MIHFIRHGESEFNRRWAENGIDPLIRDAPLSELGHAQVRETRERALALAPECVLTSPLTRAVQTAIGLFGGSGVPIIVDALHREQCTNTDDVGSDRSTLAQRFPELDFTALDTPWWHNGPTDELGVPIEPDAVLDGRVESFLELLSNRSGERLVVVGHGNFFRRIVGRHLANCEIVRFGD